jgi:uncharacterized protein (TIGR02145 family)
MPDPSAVLDLKSHVKGLLPPRLSLVALNVPDPVVSPAIGLHVYNTDTAGISPNTVYPGDYYWNGSRWVAISPPQGRNIGDMLYWNGTQWVRLPIGTQGQVLMINNGNLSWGTVPGQLPSIITRIPFEITENSAATGGNVSDGGSIVTTRGLCWSKYPNPVILDSSTIDGGGVGAFTCHLTDLAVNTRYYVRASATNSVGTAYGNEVTFRTSGCGLPLAVNHLSSGGVAPVDKTVTYGTTTDVPGEPLKCWITSNLGADHQAAGVDDSTESSAGWYWQFNQKQGYKHDGLTRTPDITWNASPYDDLDWQATNDPCTREIGNGWRIPTYTEWVNVSTEQNWTNWNGPWASQLKLHAAGFLGYSDGQMSSRGHRGVYWSSTQNTSTNGWYLTFISELSDMDYYFKGFGFPVRCIKD